MDDLRKFIRSVPDFPKPGINFYDVTTLFQNPQAFTAALDGMERFVSSCKPSKIVGIESRGFILGAALADRLNVGFVMARKFGKLPYKTITQEYELEYGTDKLQMHEDSIKKGDRVVIVDDLIATGGTLSATAMLVERLGGEVTGISSLVALTFFPFDKKLSAYRINYLVSFDSE
ncbi:MAG: adenine phosphoribosyltransferase [candidate division Zixibacteria bacterium]|nr:adenine phosphoribosyltransferase [candidate division Zixibacteria bacterium]